MILPGKENLEEKLLTMPNQIPKTVGGVNFFHWGGILYTNIWTLSNLTHQELMEEMSWWLNNERMGLWESAIQLEATGNCGWALYSMNQINKEALTEELSRRIGKTVAAWWRIISMGF